jgi:hypothetical protein
MSEKLELYDILGIVVPGALLVYVIPMCFRAPTELRSATGFPDAFLVIVLTALAVFAGHLIQALGSGLEPVLYWTWGGKPSNAALTRGLGERYLPADAADRIKRKLQAAVGPDQPATSLFLSAMQLAEGAVGSRASRFNALYAYHRALLVLTGLAMILLGAAMEWGALAPWSRETKALLLLANALLLVLLWYRAKQRSLYYVREVLLTAERIIDDRTASSSSTVTTSGD